MLWLLLIFLAIAIDYEGFAIGSACLNSHSDVIVGTGIALLIILFYANVATIGALVNRQLTKRRIDEKTDITDNH